MNLVRTFFLSLTAMLLASGCSHMAPQYSASLDNVQALKDAGDYAAKVGEFTSSQDKGNVNPLSIRGGSLASPYQNSYSHYLAEALKQELALARKLTPNADVEISGLLLKNDLDGSGVTTGSAHIEARFVVKKNGQVRYDRVKSMRHEWPSSFSGAVAIPRAILEYSRLVQKLLASLYADSAFLDALK